MDEKYWKNFFGLTIRISYRMEDPKSLTKESNGNLNKEIEDVKGI